MAFQKNLTLKQERFVHEYLVDLNATQAAIRAGYSPKTARKIGSENLSKPDISAAIQMAAQDRIERTRVDSDFVLQGAKEVFERCMQKIEPVIVNGVPLLDGEGRAVYKFDSAGAARALEIIGKHTSVNAFKLVEGNSKPVDQDWKMTVVHTTKEEFERAKVCDKEHVP